MNCSPRSSARTADRQPDQPVLGQCLPEPFDHFVKRELRCPAYLRYVDDFLLFGTDKATLWDWKGKIDERLARLRLTHPPRLRIPCR